MSWMQCSRLPCWRQSNLGTEWLTSIMYHLPAQRSDTLHTLLCRRLSISISFVSDGQSHVAVTLRPFDWQAGRGRGVDRSWASWRWRGTEVGWQHDVNERLCLCMCEHGCEAKPQSNAPRARIINMQKLESAFMHTVCVCLCIICVCTCLTVSMKELQ